MRGSCSHRRPAADDLHDGVRGKCPMILEEMIDFFENNKENPRFFRKQYVVRFFFRFFFVLCFSKKHI